MRKQQTINYSDIIGLDAPNSPELESNLLCGVINRPSVLSELESFISTDCFYEDFHKTIWKAIVNLNNEAKHIDIITVHTEANRLDPSITMYQVAQITAKNSLFEKETIEFAKLIKEYDLKRKVQLASVKTLMRLMTNDDISDIMAESENSASDIMNSTVSNSTTLEIKEIIIKAELELKDRIENKGAIGIKTGITGLDMMTGGLKPNELIVIGARPGMGKTAVLLKFIKNASQNGLSTAIFSLEMDSTRLVDRMTIAESGVDAYKFRNGFLDNREIGEVLKANERLATMKMVIDDKPNQSINYIRAVCRKRKKTKGLDLIAIDYLQLVSTSESKKGNREQEVAEISRGLKMLAKELKIPVILLCQLNREVDKRADKTPMMSDLRESGGIEQDADVIMFLLNQFKYTESDEDKNKLAIILAKQRDGAIGRIECWTNDSLTQIRDIQDGSPEYLKGDTNTPF